MTGQKSMIALWQDYLFLSGELHKFTAYDDAPLFEDILRQRNALLGIIRKTPDADGYVDSADGQALIRRIAGMDKELYGKITKSRNLLRKNFEISVAYDGISGESAAIGNRFDSGGR
jgi:hypothetical protein